uniref:Uncharacterized protein n=1 Tax=Brassica oleracea TaxID=3712 RepID=A0A3P6CCI8_BRAOL|nr:unnamed protein product [Brassica oleracea]
MEPIKLERLTSTPWLNQKNRNRQPLSNTRSNRSRDLQPLNTPTESRSIPANARAKTLTGKQSNDRAASKTRGSRST